MGNMAVWYGVLAILTNFKAFVATHADQLSRTEIVHNLHLERDSSKLECALARNAWTKDRIKSDFQAGIQEMIQFGRQASASMMHEYHLPVFTVSSMDYQKLVQIRKRDGTAETFTRVPDTGMWL